MPPRTGRATAACAWLVAGYPLGPTL